MLCKIEIIRHEWNLAVESANDRMEPALKKVEDLQAIQINRDFAWPESWNAPPFLLPKFEENAEIINDVLIKSMKTQGSSCPFPGCPKRVLIEDSAFTINGFLAYYFKHIPSKFLFDL